MTTTAIDQPERERIVHFFQKHPLGVLATTDDTGNPHASTIYVSVSDDLRITFTTKRETQKYRNIAHNNHVMLVAYEAASQTAIQIRGRAVEITDPEAQHEVYYGTLEAAQKTGEDVVPPIAKVAAGPYVGFTIEIDDARLSEYGWGNTFAHSLKHAAEEHASGDPL